ncbi:hypothetical protein CEUSTIGMA_g2290.t1 [Chlamydomonas eustigma]|uniref:Major facilitator superfamily (MFS) profile domain-containing protein n=1 Tax=Chlamydomonas eustigma TaxID=1157962 RepID=A0A250WVH4_9CHLO|nr:hypothetical protein CEUSTIGMA_g2290.t1 [Chlamydomonas eustigma]|eukprot:GAX74844.1 hypothetical protein CEUSTIGMA_g2290.t1 [Chlamydomonas eustigma]
MATTNFFFTGNVGLTFGYRICDGLATGIWSSSVLSTYLSVLMGGDDAANEDVGVAQAIQGLFFATAALPAGWLAGKVRKDAILRWLGLIQLLAIAMTSWALMNQTWEPSFKFKVLCAALALWGIGQGNSPVLDSLFADSIPTGCRSQLYTWLHVGYILSQGLGPATTAIMFYWTGDTWSIVVLQHVMLLGMLVAFVPTLLLLCFNDDWTLGAESDSIQRILRQQQQQRAATAGAGGDEEQALYEPLLGKNKLEELEPVGSNDEDSGAASWNRATEQNLDGFDVSSFRSPSRLSLPTSAQPSPGMTCEKPLHFVEVEGQGSGLMSVEVEQHNVESFALDLSDSLTDYSNSRTSSIRSYHSRSGGPGGASEPMFVAMAPVQENEQPSSHSSPQKPLAQCSEHLSGGRAAGGAASATISVSPTPGRRLHAAKNEALSGASHPKGVPVKSKHETQPSYDAGGEKETTAVNNELDNSTRRGSCCCCCFSLGPEWIPVVLAFTDCIFGLASGMTIKFFPIFFMQEVGLPPSQVAVLYCAIPLALSLFAFASQKAARAFGRVQVMTMNRAVGIAILYWIALNDRYWTQPHIMMPVYLLRTSIMNCNFALQKSILMDYVSKENRAKWNSFEAITVFGWSGSAALGGWLIHEYGFQVTFHITATMQLISWCFTLLLLHMVPLREVSAADLASSR